MHLRWLQLFFVFIASGFATGKKHYFFSKVCKPDAKEPWSYRGKNGPYHWGELFPTCKGDYQSPIAINHKDAIYDEELVQLKLYNYEIPVKGGEIENDGRTVLVNITDGIERYIVANDDKYRLAQFHFHWGDAYYKGSEHVIDETKFSMEMHLVHRNSKDEVAVVAVLFQEQNKEHPELQKIVDHFPGVTFRDQKIPLECEINLSYLLPSNPASFYRYYGSLTTPACAEGVTWSILPDPLPVGFKQMAQFRSLNSARKSEASWKCKLVNNFRPVQPLNDRKVFFSQ